MMTIQRPVDSASAKKPAKRSVLGMLFNPQLGPAISPLRENTRVFVHLVAMVFSMYGLFPKDHPALRDQNARLSLFNVIGTAWGMVRFTRETAAQAVIFFAVVGMMAFSGLMAVFALLSLLMGHAHAQTVANASAFSPESKDLAQAWMDYLFNNASSSFPTFTDTYDDATAALQDPFQGNNALQLALMNALAFYSDAILIVAAIILFYHLTAMVVETAHHGVPMGKRASQIWAPIRLVVAIGLLVPINGGLNCGQFLVIKIAELGSGLASQTWDIFLTQLESYNSQAVPPPGPVIDQVALDIIRMEACRLSWNQHVDEQNASVAEIPEPTTGTQVTMGSLVGTQYAYSSNSLADTDVCGWYFIPSGGNNALATQAAQQQLSAINTAMGPIQTAAKDITSLIPPSGTTTTGTSAASPATITFNTHVSDAVAAYQAALKTNMTALANNQTSQIGTALQKVQQYGWVMAGTLLNTIDRIQGNMAAAASDSMPKTQGPLMSAAKEPPGGVSGWINRWFFGKDGSEAWDIRKMVAEDMASFDYFVSKSITAGQPSGNTGNVAGTGAAANSDAQCAAMVGLTSGTGGWASGGVNWLFGKVDWLAAHNGVWTEGTGAACSSAPNAPTTFALGVQINGQDPFAQMAFLGHANLDVAFDLIAMSMGSSLVGGVASAIPYVGGAINGIMSGAGGLLSFLALVFFTCGFTLAYLVPLMPFMRFFFAVLSWVAAIIEAIVAIPLVALAHLNPEGEGLPGQQARNAYFFVFNLFLRPVLIIFGFICGLIIFMIALSFLNYAYAIAVAGAGGTSYGHAAMSKIVYSILYVAILYICANHSFQLIDHLPQHAMSWMGAQGQAMPNMGDAGKVEQLGAAISTIAGQQGISQLGNAAKGLGEGVGSGIKGIGDGMDKKKSKKIAQQQHNDEMRGMGGKYIEDKDGKGGHWEFPHERHAAENEAAGRKMIEGMSSSAGGSGGSSSSITGGGNGGGSGGAPGGHPPIHPHGGPPSGGSGGSGQSGTPPVNPQGGPQNQNSGHDTADLEKLVEGVGQKLDKTTELAQSAYDKANGPKSS